MRCIRLFALGIISFVAALMGALLAPGTFVNRALSAALCTVFSFNSTICTVNLAKSSDRVVAATPPAVERNISDWLVQRAPGEFDDAPSVRPGSNPQAPPFPQDPGPNQPVRPDFDNSNAPNRPQSPNPSIPLNSQSPRSGTRRNNSSLLGTRKIAPDRLETQFVTGEGCRVNKIFRVINKEQIFQESIQITAPDNNTCGGVSYSYQFQPDGKQIDIEAGSDVKFTFVDDNPFIELRYDISGKKGVLRFDPNRNSTSQSLVLASNLLSPNSTKKKLLPVTNKEPAILIANTTTLVAENDPRINANDLGLGNDPSVLKDVDEKLREMGGPAERILRPLVREICQAGEDVTNKTLDAATGDATDLALDAALEKAVKDSSEYKILKLIKKVKDNWDTITQLITKGISFDNLQEIARDRLKSSFENMLKSRRLGLNCEKFDYNPDADRVITEGCTVCTCCVYTAQYQYSHNGQVSGGTFNAPCKGSIEQIVAKINSDLARDIARRQLPYTATVVGTPQRNTEPPPECDGSLQTTQQPTGQLKTASSWGDPHLTSFDGQKYDHHAIGEFVLTRSKDKHFEVQVREAPYGSSSSLAINIAAAMRVGNDRVAIYSQDFPDNNTQDPLRVNGKTISGEKQNLSGGGFVARTGSGSYLVQWPSGEQVTVKIFNKLVEVTPGVSEGDRGQLEGLLGNFNGNPSDDFMTRDGRVIAENKEAMNIARSVLSNFDVSRWIPIPIDPLTEAFLDSIHRQFGDSWRISKTESLFDYPAGKNTDSFTNKSFPNGFVILRMLAPQAVQLAEETCRKAEVPNERLEGCLFDVAASGDVSLANVAANILQNEVKQRVEQEIRNRVPVPIPLPF